MKKNSGKPIKLTLVKNEENFLFKNEKEIAVAGLKDLKLNETLADMKTEMLASYKAGNFGKCIKVCLTILKIKPNLPIVRLIHKAAVKRRNNKSR